MMIERARLNGQRIGLDGQAYLVHDFQVESLQRRHMRGGIGEQPNLADVQIGKYLTAKPYLAQNPLMPVPCSPLRSSRCRKSRCGVTLRSISKPLLVLCR